MKNLKKRSQGFTIIEITIVLAIAGLIMLIVFLAVPALRRNTANTQRRSDASHLAGLVNEYASNHGGTLPTTIGTGNNTLDLSKETFNIMSKPATANIVTAATYPPTTDDTSMNIVKGFSCDPTTNTLTAGTNKAFAIAYNIDTSSGTFQNTCIGQ